MSDLDRRTVELAWPESQVLMDIFRENPLWRVHLLDDAYVVVQVTAHLSVHRTRYNTYQWGCGWDECSNLASAEARLSCDCGRCLDEWWRTLERTTLHREHDDARAPLRWTLRGPNFRQCPCYKCAHMERAVTSLTQAAEI